MRALAVSAAVAALVSLAACSGDDSGSAATSTKLAGSSTTSGQATFPTTNRTTAGSGTTTAGTTTTGASSTSGSPGTSTSPEPTTTTPFVPLTDVHIQLQQVGSVDEPVGMAVRSGDDAFYVVSQAGTIVTIRNGVVQANPALDLTDLTAASGEQGLLGLAFSPDGRKAYVHFTQSNGDGEIDELAVRADGTIDKRTRRPLLTNPHPDFPNHNGGSVVVGPDGLLYLGFGDGGGAGDPLRSGQNPDTFLGKILRIDPTPSGDEPYTIPADNPFAGQSGVKQEIWSYGLRNPWRFSFDRATGDLWIGDVGQDQWEEVDVVAAADGAGAGVNFGWSAFEGNHPFNADQTADNAVSPIYEYPHGDGDASISGGYVYRGTAIPALVGTYLFGDYGSGKVRGLRPNDEAEPEVAVLATTQGISSFGEDAAGELYVLSLANNAVYRIVPG